MRDEDAVAAVLIPPQLERFRELCGVEGGIEARFGGFTKHVLLTADRAFLFPRNHTIVRQLERECDVYASVDLPLIPRLCGNWRDAGVSPYPFFAIARLDGDPLTGMTAEAIPSVGSQLGGAIADYHGWAVETLPARFRKDRAAKTMGVDYYTPVRFVGGAEYVLKIAVVAADLSTAAAAHLERALDVTEAMVPVLAHGDLHESQLLADIAGQLTGILDWGFAGVISPLADFTASQFEGDLLAGEQTYGALRRAMWTTYAERRDGAVPSIDEFDLAMAAFDITALAPDSRTHYYWQKDDDWRWDRRAAAIEFLRAALI